jgi:hypothetical protein
MAIGPRLDPFPLTTAFVVYDGDTAATDLACQAIFNDPTHDGVQWNYMLGGDGEAWAHQYSGYVPGLNDGEWPEPTVQLTYQAYNYQPTRVITPGVYDTSEFMTDAWYTFDITNPTVVGWYHTTVYKQPGNDPFGLAAPPLVPGIHTYPGVACVSHMGNLPGQWGSAVYLGRPVWYEAWFSENTQRTSQTIGYNGYTSFWGRQETGSLMDDVLEQVPGAWIRRFVQGVIKRGADVSTCTASDIMCGMIVVGTGTSTTMQFCINGIVMNTYTFPDKATYAGTQLILELSNAFSSGLTSYTGGLSSTAAYVGNATYSYGTDQWNTAFSLYHPQYNDPATMYGYDSYDTKYVWYADVPSDHPVGQTFTFTDQYRGEVISAFWFESPNMYTHPGWPVAADMFNISVPSAITAHPSPGNVSVTGNQYPVYAGNIHTRHVNLTSVGEIRVDGNPGTAGDLLLSSGTGSPVRWDNTLETKMASIEGRAAALPPQYPPVVATLSGPTSVNSGAQISLTTSVSGGVAPYTYAYTATGGTVTIPATANPTFTAPTLTPGGANATLNITLTASDNIVPPNTGTASTSITIVAPASAGSIAASTIPLLGAAALPLVQNGSVDDGFVTVVLPFAIRYLGVSYSTIYIGSNSYATFTAGSSQYSGLSASSPALPGIRINAADNSYQRVYAGSENSGTTFRIRFEGTASTGGTVGSPNMVWELTFTQSTPEVIKLSIGTNARSGAGTSGCSNGSTYMLAIPATNANTGYTITSA